VENALVTAPKGYISLASGARGLLPSWEATNNTLDLYSSGHAVMGMCWARDLPVLTDKKRNPFASTTGFFPVPQGPAGRFTSANATCLSVSAFSNRQALAKQFLTWFSSRAIQPKWARLGGLTCNLKVLNSPEYRGAASWHTPYAQSMDSIKIFPNDAPFTELCRVAQTNLNEAVYRHLSPEACIEDIAARHTAILKHAGILK